LDSSRSSLPVPAWTGTPPDAFADPALYGGIRSRRIFGYLVDLILIGLITLALWFALVLVGVLSFGLLMPLVPLGVAVVPTLYHTFTVGGPRSATPGMRLFDVTVRSWTGERPSLLQAFLLTVTFLVSVGVTGFLILLVSLFNSRGRTLHELLSGTVVVRRSALERPGA
jgi:uncharacterized RDD family membrane protein YckC